jgi:hypothetical protein
MVDPTIAKKVLEVVERCKAGEGVVKWHEPSFVQLQPDKHIHLNFWGHPTGAMTPCYVPTHTHDYGFNSHIVFGEVHNVRCQVADTVDGEFTVHIVDDEDWNRLLTFRNTGRKATILREKREVLTQGKEYEMDPREWHRSEGFAPAMTYLDMWDHAPLDYSVLCDDVVEQSFDQSNRFVAPERMPALWDYVTGMCKLAGVL